jgi:hypothetical protein
MVRNGSDKCCTSADDKEWPNSRDNFASNCVTDALDRSGDDPCHGPQKLARGSRGGGEMSSRGVILTRIGSADIWHLQSVRACA